MIVRSRPHWLRMLFVLRGSILPTISPQLIIITLFATLVTALHGQILDWKVSLNFVPFSLIGVSLAIFLAFATAPATPATGKPAPCGDRSWPPPDHSAARHSPCPATGRLPDR